jgi:hypothetical protein
MVAWPPSSYDLSRGRNSDEPEGVEREMAEHRTQSRRTGGSDAAAVSAGSPRSGVPGAVQTAFLLWLVAVGAGVAETIVRLTDSLAAGAGAEVSGVVIRAIVYTAVIYVATRMRSGKRWARDTLAIALGVVGTLSLVIDPISWLAAGNSLRDVFADADLLFAFVAPIRAVHLAAVIGALVFMYRPDAAAYFRAAR